MPTTIRDIARATGVGRTAVSLALRGAPGVAEATRQQVLDVATKLGYQADPLIARLAERRWKTREAVTVAVVGGTQPTALRAMLSHTPQFRWEFFNIEAYSDPQRLRRVLEARGIEALLLDQITDHRFTERFDFAGLATISLAAGLVRLPIHQVRPDVARGLSTAWSKAVGHGLKRIGFVYFDEPEARDFIDRDGAVRSLQERSRLHRTPPLLLPVSKHLEQTRIFKDWFERERPDCVIAQTPTVYWLMKELRIQMPGQCAFVSLLAPAEPQNRFTHCSVSQSMLLDGAVWLLERLLRENQRGIPAQRFKLLIEPKWTPGNTFQD